MHKFIISLITFLIFSFAAYSSDHIDGPATREDKRADISDLYAFPTKGSKNKLNLILNTYPFVVNGHFDSKIEYEFLIRQAKLIDGKIVAGELNIINCHFNTPHNHHNHTMTCRSLNELSISAKFNGKPATNTVSGMRAFTGKRSDPFFINTDFAVELSEGKIPHGHFPDGSTKLNVLSIVLEVDLNKLFKKESDIYLIAAQSLANNGGIKKSILDRVGRAEVTNISLSDKYDIEVRDDYNTEETFNLSKKKELYKLRLKEKIMKYDLLDNTVNWNYEQRNRLVDLLLDDYLILDISKNCKPAGFLEIEKAMLKGKTHKTCGGRKLTDDIVDIMYTFYINTGSGVTIGDDATEPHKKPSKEFPYLREPTTGFLAVLKANLANLLKF